MRSAESIVVDAVTIAVKRSGHGAPVICLAAIGHDAHDFTPLARRIGDRFELICIEWPAHGDSSPDHRPANAARYAELLDGALRQLDIDRPIVIGNSIGGAAAILYAAQHPVRGLVLCDCGGLVEVDRSVATFCGLFAHFFAAGERGAWWYPAAFASYYRVVLRRPEAAEQRRRIVARARPLAPTLREAWASFGRPEADIRAVAAGLDAPVWVAWATHDKVIPLSRCRPAIESLRNATLTTFDAGHTPFLEQPDAFADGFVAFAESLEPSAETRAAQAHA